MSYTITLDAFQGPLDLLLYLVDKNKVDIYEIPIAEITSQYMEYINQWKSINLEVASEFLIMAATLLEIKSKMLLPKDKKNEERSLEEDDPRQELIERLREYKQFKQISIYLKDREKNQKKIVYKDPEYFPELEGMQAEIDLDLDKLFKTFQRLLLKENTSKNTQENFHEIEKEIFTLEDKMEDIIEKLEDSGTQLKLDFFVEHCRSRNEMITIFLAILELTKIKIIKVQQQELFEEIMIIKQNEE